MDRNHAREFRIALRIGIEQMGVCGRSCDVTGVAEGLQFGNQVDTVPAGIMRQFAKLLRRKRILVEQETGRGGKPYGAALVVCYAELERVESPLLAKIDHSPVVTEGLWNPARIHH